MRRWAIAVLLVLVALGGAASVLGVWAKRTLLDTDRFTGVVMGLAAEPALSDAIASAVVDELVTIATDRRMLADRVPPNLEPFLPLLLAAVRPAVEAEVAEVLAGPRAQALLEAAVARAHAATLHVLRSDAPFSSTVLSASGSQVTLDLVGLVALGFDRLVERGILPSMPILNPGGTDPSGGPRTGDQIRQAIGDATRIEVADDFGVVVVYDSPRIERAGLLVRQARTSLALFERAVVIIVVTTLALATAAVALSHDRRRTGLALGLIAAGIGLASVLVSRRVAEAIPALISDPDSRAAVRAVVAQFAGGLVRLSEALVAIGILVVLAAWLAGPGSTSREMRRRLAEVRP